MKQHSQKNILRNSAKYKHVSTLVKEAERYVQKKGGTDITLHAQCQASGFYKKSGFVEFGKIEDEQGCPHIWMKKSI